MTLENYSIEALKAEIERREREADDPRPEMKDNIKIAEAMNVLGLMVNAYLDEVEKGNDPDNERHYIFEAAIEAFYPENLIWPWVNRRLK